ncbi:MAG TPA: hypothetical protein VHJ34_11285 [Actinomycetota bacterium]|nr:hypothetical protein [Actinomycetota bacterium]
MIVLRLGNAVRTRSSGRDTLRRRVAAIGSWVSHEWLWLIGVALALPASFLVVAAWALAGRPVRGTEGLLGQLGALVTTAQFVLGCVLAVTAMYQARQNAETARRTQERDVAERRRERIGIVHAFVGSAIEGVGHASSFAALQHEGLRKWIPQSRAQQEFVYREWERLREAGAAVAKALERIRYSEPDLVPQAEALFDEVMNIHDAAIRGQVDAVQDSAHHVRDALGELRAAVESDGDG